jgi:hypothetical protein
VREAAGWANSGLGTSDAAASGSPNQSLGVSDAATRVAPRTQRKVDAALATEQYYSGYDVTKLVSQVPVCSEQYCHHSA